MSVWTFFRRNAMPVAPEQDAIYYIADPENSALCDGFVSGDLGHIRKIKGVTNEADVQAIIDANESVLAAQALGGHRAITAAGLHATDATLDLVIGITSGAAVQGDLAPYVSGGPMDEGGWNWTPGGPVFVGANGVLTQIEPVGALKRIGTAVTATRLAVDLQPTIYRG